MPPHPDQVQVGVSSCLLGQQVRYDGRHKHDPHLTDLLGGRVRWVPVCPELDIGLGVPREPIHLVPRPGEPRLVGVHSGDDHTVAMRGYAEQRVGDLEHAGLDAYVLKSRSPSCGAGDVPVHHPEDGSVTGHDRGRFTAVLIDRIPDLPVVEEGQLDVDDVRDRFLERLCVRHRWRTDLPADRAPADLVAFHTRHEMQVLAHSPGAYRHLGALAGRAGADDLDPLLVEYRDRLHRALDEPTSRGRHVNVLQRFVGMLDEPHPELAAAVERYAAGEVPWADVADRLRAAATGAPSWFASQTYLDPLAELGLTPSSW